MPMKAMEGGWILYSPKGNGSENNAKSKRLKDDQK